MAKTIRALFVELVSTLANAAAPSAATRVCPTMSSTVGGPYAARSNCDSSRCGNPYDVIILHYAQSPLGLWKLPVIPMLDHKYRELQCKYAFLNETQGIPPFEQSRHPSANYPTMKCMHACQKQVSAAMLHPLKELQPALVRCSVPLPHLWNPVPMARCRDAMILDKCHRRILRRILRRRNPQSDNALMDPSALLYQSGVI